MVLVSAGETDLAGSLDMMTLMAGWRFEEPERFVHSAAVRTVYSSRNVLEWAGSGVLLSRDRNSDALAAPGARQLARTAVLASAWR